MLNNIFSGARYIASAAGACDVSKRERPSLLVASTPGTMPSARLSVYFTEHGETYKSLYFKPNPGSILNHNLIDILWKRRRYRASCLPGTTRQSQIVIFYRTLTRRKQHQMCRLRCELCLSRGISSRFGHQSCNRKTTRAESHYSS